MKKIFDRSSLIVYLSVLVGLIAVCAVIFAFKPLYAQVVMVVIFSFLVLFPILIKNPEFGLAIVGFFLPFERVPSIDIGGMSVKVNYILILLVLIMYISVKGFRKELKLPKDPIIWALVIFLISISFSLTQAVDFSRALQVFAFTALMGIVYFTVSMVAQDKKSIILIVKGILIGAAASVLFGLYQFLGDMVGLPNSITLLKEGYDKSTFGFARVQAGAQEPLYFANYIFIPLAISLVLLIRDKAREIFPKWFVVLLTIGLLLNFILTISRGAFIAAGVTFVVLLIVQAKRIFRIHIILPTVLIIGVVLIGVYLALLKSEPRAIDEYIGHLFVNDRQVGESVVMRLSASEQALEMFSNNQLVGVGLGNFGPATLSYPSAKPDDGWPIVNNEYLEMLAETGIVGFIGFLILFGAVFIRSIIAFFKSKDQLLKTLMLGLILAFLAIMVQYATFSTIYIFHIWFLMGMMGAVSNLTIKQLSNS
ncbi:MAG: O-antigen ligase family protein [Candidatus Berkelbacteria bacterium]|nr:O-antigen ligase family protein [Candidatus Berkelbacteria bacterium]